jgi:uncharacterized protein YoxC
MSKHIFSKIAKVGEEVRAAKTIKVEFAVIDDLKKSYTALEKSVDSIDGAHQKSLQKINMVLADSKQKIATAIDDFEIALLKLQELAAPVKSQSNNFVKAAKELGMNPDDSPIYKEASRVMQDYDSSVSYYNGELSKLNAVYTSLKGSL